MLIGARIFIGLMFTVIGLSFLLTTGTLVYEFWTTDWLTLATFYSHLFIFFPVFGIVALFAFYTPACVFFDMYWSGHVPRGQIRFVVGFVVVAALAILAAEHLKASPQRSVWEVAPAALLADAAEPSGCDGRVMTCQRVPILTAIDNVRRVSQSRIGLSDLARNCRPDPLVETTRAPNPRRFCFASMALSDRMELVTDEACCEAQGRLVAAVGALHDDPANRSLTGKVHAALLPLKIFFMLVLVAISAMLALRRKSIEDHYTAFLRPIERGVLIGAGAMIFYPLMNHAFLQSAALLYGGGEASAYRSPGPFISFAFGAWGLLILFFFYRRHNKQVESVGRIGGLVISAIAIVKYEVIVDFVVRLLGSGAGAANLVVLVALALAALFALYQKTSYEMSPEGQSQEVKEVEEELREDGA